MAMPTDGILSSTSSHWTSHGCCACRVCAVPGMMPDSSTPPPPQNGGIYGLSSPKDASATSAAAPLPMPGRLIPAQASFHPLLGSDESPWGRAGWYLDRQLGPLYLRRRWEAFQHPPPADSSQRLPAFLLGCSVQCELLLALG